MTAPRDRLAEQAWGVLVAADREGSTDWNVVAHAIAGNLLPVVDAIAAERAAEELEAAAKEQQDEADLHAASNWGMHAGGHVCAADDLHARAAALRTASRGETGR